MLFGWRKIPRSSPTIPKYNPGGGDSILSRVVAQVPTTAIRQRAPCEMHPPWLTDAMGWVRGGPGWSGRACLVLDATQAGAGSAPEKPIDSLWPFCYSTQFARCAGKLLRHSRPGVVAVAYRGNGIESGAVAGSNGDNAGREGALGIMEHFGGSMMKLRISATLWLACAGLMMMLSGCGGGNSQMISIVLATANGLTDDGRVPGWRRLRRARSTIMASVGGDTSGKGVTWMFQKNQSGCGSAGSTQPSCGTLSNASPFSVTYTAPSITTTLSVIIEATSVADTTVTKTITLSIVLPPVFAATECNPAGVLPCTLANGNNAVPYTQNFTFTGGVSPYTYTLLGSLPPLP